MSISSKHKPHLVVLSGAGISAESGLKTFRDSGGLWEGYDVRDVATPEAWLRNPELVLQFYNQRRRAMREARPNQAHLALAQLEEDFRVSVVTQNVDDLHERAGSTKVLHLHGELTRSRSTIDPHLRYSITGCDLLLGDRCELGSQLRPDIVWFGEEVPSMAEAQSLVQSAEIFVVIGTSLAVYPAAGLVGCVPSGCQCYLIDLHPPASVPQERFAIIQRSATEGIQDLLRLLKKATPASRISATSDAAINQ